MTSELLEKMVKEAIQAQKGGGKKDYEPFPPPWKPAVGEVGEFLITKSVEVTSKFGGGARVVRFVIDREGNQFCLPSSSGIVRELIKAKAGIGDFVYIRFDGEKPLKNPKPGFNSAFKAYTVVVIPKEAFEKTGEQFAAIRPVPKKEATQTPAPAATQASTPAPTPVVSSDDKDVKRLADAVSKYSGGMKPETFQKMYRLATHDETKTITDALLDHSEFFELVGNAGDGTERVQRVVPA